MSDAQSLYAPDWLTYPEHPAELNRTIWTDSFQRNHGGELTIDGIAASELVKKFDTPQYVFSEDTFRARARGYRQAFEDAFARYG
ncbi:MAG: diaminopimelate decarboxylase, partial [Rothia dentocariosa]